MTIEIDPSELGAYTNNLPNKEGIKKLLKKIEEGGGSSDAYTKAETDALLDEKQNVLTAGTNITIVEDVISAVGGTYKRLTASQFYDSFITENNVKVTNKDMIIVFVTSDGGSTKHAVVCGSIFLPKGTSFRNKNGICVSNRTIYSNGLTNTQISPIIIFGAPANNGSVEVDYFIPAKLTIENGYYSLNVNFMDNSFTIQYSETDNDLTYSTYRIRAYGSD